MSWKDFKKGMHDFGQAIATLVNVVLLSIVYFIGVGITSIIGRISGKCFLDTRIDKKAKTYWVDLDLKKKALEEYYRQF